MRISNSATRLRATQFLATITALVILFSQTCPRTKAQQTKPPLTELLKGFTAKPDHSAKTSPFQPLLRDVTGNFSFGFLRTNRTHLSVAVVHVASLEPLWTASRNLQWSENAEIAFNGSLVITDPKSNLRWSTKTSGDKVTLLYSSSLEISTSDDVVSWRSFDFPGNTLVEGQNFSDAMSLVSSNGQYSMKLGSDFWGLYAAFKGGGEKSQLYLRHTAMQAKAKVVTGNGSLYLRVDPNGYLGMYQTGTEPAVDLVPFGIYTRHVSGPVIVRLENDGNLKAYFWSGSEWVKSYEAVSETCELPNPCGPYGLCKSGSGCSCLNNRTECVARGVKSSGDFCGVGKNDFSVLRRVGVEPPFKELMTSETTSSLEDCEGICANSCRCWGSFYNNDTGFCYTVDYPIQTVLAVGDESKAGYFKVREGVGRDKVGVLFRVLICVLVGVILVISGIIGVFVYKAWKRKKGKTNRFFEEETGGVSPGPYKDLGSASFSSIEMCNSHR